MSEDGVFPCDPRKQKQLDILLAEYAVVVSAHDAVHQGGLNRVLTFIGLMSVAYTFALSNKVWEDRLMMLIFGNLASFYWFVAMWRDVEFIQRRFAHGRVVEHRIQNIMNEVATASSHENPTFFSECVLGKSLEEASRIPGAQHDYGSECCRVYFVYFHFLVPVVSALAWLLLLLPFSSDADRS